MLFLVDECVGISVVNWLNGEGHDAKSAYDYGPGLTDEVILEIALSEHRIVLTVDKDFGELVHRAGQPHAGVLLLRLEDETSRSVIAVLARVLDEVGDGLLGAFVVATELRTRVSLG